MIIILKMKKEIKRQWKTNECGNLLFLKKLLIPIIKYRDTAIKVIFQLKRMN